MVRITRSQLRGVLCQHVPFRNQLVSGSTTRAHLHLLVQLLEIISNPEDTTTPLEEPSTDPVEDPYGASQSFLTCLLISASQ